MGLGCWAPCQDNACRAYLGKALGHNPLGSSGMLEEMVVDETREKAGHICFRKCTIEDLAKLRALSSRTFFETFAAQNKPEDMETYLKDAFSEEKMRAELLEPGSTFYFLLVDSELAGYLKLNECGAQTDIHSPDSLEIERIYLDKRFQGKGLGNCLMDNAVEVARQKGMRSIWLGVWEKNTRALAFYQNAP